MRVVRHGCGVTTHDAGERFDLHVIGNHADLVIHRDRVAIEQFELLTRLAPAHVQTTMYLVQIKNVGWAAELEHHVVGNVHQSRDAALATAGQAVHHPLGRFGFGIDVANHAAREAAAQIGRTHLHRQTVSSCNRNGRESGCFQRRVSQRSQFTRHAIHAQAVRQVRCELEGQQCIVKLEKFADVLTQRCVERQFQQPTMVV